MAGASDPGAQRWLEWPDKYLVPEGKRERFLNVWPGTGFLVPSRLTPDDISLVAVDPELNQLAGSVSMNWETREIGGWLVPEYRSRGLGAALFAAGAELAHRHLGITTVRAGAHPGNAACIGALTAAGFTRAPGPATHVQPNGRVIPARWFRHERDHAGYCDFRRKPSLARGPDRYDRTLDAPRKAGSHRAPPHADGPLTWPRGIKSEAQPPTRSTSRRRTT